MAVRVAINGFGRIGRCVFRAAEGSDLEIVAINDLTDTKTLAHLLKYDTIHGRFGKEVSVDGDYMVVDGRKVRVTAERSPAALPWKECEVDFVVEATGVFRDKKSAMAHVEAGAKKVVISAPGKDVDGTFAVGVNHEDYDPAAHTVVSNASCTTNCLAPMAKVLNDAFGLEHGLMTTIHSVTNDQRILDLPHKDLRRARAAYESMIPTTTGAAKAVGLVLPELQGKLNGFAIRVPTMDVSVVDLVATLSKDVSAEQVNAAMKAAADGPLSGVLVYNEEPLVSSDFIGSPASCTLDAPMTTVIADRMVKVMGWYDNEWGYSSRVIDLVRYMASR